METYLTVMVTALVLTQIIRVTQNAMQLKRLKALIGPATDTEVLAMWERLVESVDRLAAELEEGE